MSKLLAVWATLKLILFASCAAFARGEILPVILISAVFSLVQLGGKPVEQFVPSEKPFVLPRDAGLAFTSPTEQSDEFFL
jgi:hypothetical protein